MQTILVVDDSRVILAAVKQVLAEADYEVLTAQSGDEALHVINQQGLPHLALVDIHMPPGMDGFTFCKKVHQFSDLPIIMLTALDDEETVVQGLKQHAEDYVTKPFRANELIARVERVLRRIGDFSYTMEAMIQVDDRLHINLPQRQAIIAETLVKLTPIEAKILYLLMKHAGRTVQTEFLLRRLWPLEEAFEDRLHAHIYRLRKKIEENPKEPNYIISEWSKGYMFPNQSS